MKELELLAPVGKMESLYAAVQNGADAVYLGGKLFNARHYASNFTDEELLEAVKYAHLRNVKVYITINILIDESEIEQAIDYIKSLYDMGIDGLIMQDLGLASLVHGLFPELEIHGSTQMTVNNAEGAKFLYENGFSRVVLARETPIEEIKKIKQRTPIELEVFIHGALCVSYSGQCLMSSMIGGRSGNRGTCAQPCRMPSTLVSKEGYELKDWRNKHILSPKDLNTVEEIENLIEAGIVSFKIEGRMKRPEYVATVVKTYRKAIDLGASKITEEEMKDMRQIFNRGFTKGIALGDFGENFITYDRPNNRGIYLGKVIKISRETVCIKLEDNLEIGDGIEFHLAEDKHKGMKSGVEGEISDIVEVKKIGNIKMGQSVYKTSSIELIKRSNETYFENNILKDIEIVVDIKLGKIPSLKLKYNDYEIEVFGEKEVEESNNKPIEEQRVLEQISKLGDTVYNIKDIKINVEDNCFMPVSILNKMRRDATDALDTKILSEFEKNKIDKNSFDINKREAINFEFEDFINDKILSAKVENLEILKSLELDKINRIYLNFYAEKEIIEALKYLYEKDLDVFIATEKILYEKDLEFLKGFLEDNEKYIQGVSVSNIGTFEFIRKNFKFLIHGDIGMNIFNSYTLKFLKDNGMDSATLSAELNLRQIKNILKKKTIPTSAVVYGYIPVMVTKHCPMSLVKGCSNDLACKTCQYRDGYKIKDRIDVEFRMVRKTGFTNIYNSVPIMVLDDMDNISNSGLDEFILIFTFNDEKTDIVEPYKLSIEDNISRIEMEEIVSKYRKIGITKGHFFRGIVE